MLGMGELSMDDTMRKFNETLDQVKRMNVEFKNPVSSVFLRRPIDFFTEGLQDLTTFVCVCIAEFLSLYETERLIQELTKQVSAFDSVEGFPVLRVAFVFRVSIHITS